MKSTYSFWLAVLVLIMPNWRIAHAQLKSKDKEEKNVKKPDSTSTKFKPVLDSVEPKGKTKPGSNIKKVTLTRIDMGKSSGTPVTDESKLNIDDWADIVSAIIGVAALIFSAFNYRTTFSQFRSINQSYLSVNLKLAYNLAPGYPPVAAQDIQLNTMVDGFAPYIDITNVGKMPAKYRVLSGIITVNGLSQELINQSTDFVDGILMPGEMLTFNTNAFPLGQADTVSSLNSTDFQFQFRVQYQDFGLKFVKILDRKVKIIISGLKIHVRNISFDDRLD